MNRIVKLWQLAGLAGALLVGGVASADVIQGTPVKGDTRLIQYVYQADNTYLVLAKPKAVTHLQFAANETIRSVAAGDTSSWEITATKDRRNLFVKPHFDGEETSMTVLTDQRSYQFVLRSTGDGKKWHQRVTWIHGGDMVVNLPDAEVPEITATVKARGPDPLAGVEAGVPGLRPDALRFHYEVSGDAPFRPAVVFDDGRFTYLKLPAGVQELPALFAVTDDKEYALVNFEVKGEYLVVQRLLPAAVLKLGKAEVRVTQQLPKARSFLGVKLEN